LDAQGQADVLRATSGPFLVSASRDGHVKLLDLTTQQWVASRRLALESGHEVQSLCVLECSCDCGRGLAYLKLPLRLVRLDLDLGDEDLQEASWDAPWIHDPALFVSDCFRGCGLQEQKTKLVETGLVPRHDCRPGDSYSGALEEFASTGRTQSPAQLAMALVHLADAQTLARLLDAHGFDACMASFGGPSGSALHALCGQTGFRRQDEVLELVQTRAKARAGPLLYLPPGSFKVALDNMRRGEAESFVRDLLAHVFVNVDELV
jgi:hypothetical protein